MNISIPNEASQLKLGQVIGQALSGGEFIELSGDLGTGKTTLTQGIASGLGVKQPVQSPTFTISRVYDAPKNLQLTHYDFYRLEDAGIMSGELAEAASDENNIIIIEWATVAKEILPNKRLVIRINYKEDGRELIFTGLDNYPAIKKVLTRWKN